MEQLTLGEILKFAKELKANGMTDKEIKALPIYLGDDDELNGIHCGWYTNLVDADSDDEQDECFVEMINDSLWRDKFETGKAILIS
jgi:hypothetical protein